MILERSFMRLTRTLGWLFAVLFLSLICAEAQTEKSSQKGKNVATKDEAQIRDLYDRWAKAFQSRDVDKIMSVYAPGDAVVAYDIVPPLQYLGNDAYRKDYQEFLAQFDGPL